MTYFNTTHTDGQQLSQYRRAASSQDERIMQASHVFPASPSVIWARVFNRTVPLTSVRRAMTNLSNDGKLVKTGKQVNGHYGRPEYVWKLAPGQRRLFE